MKTFLIIVLVLTLLYVKQDFAQTPTPNPCANNTTVTPTQTPIPTVNDQQVTISEVMVYPDAGESEWVELHNESSLPIHLDNWQIDDVENGGASPKSITVNIAPYGYAAITLSTSIFNNDGDWVRLLDPAGIVHDNMQYTASQQGVSIGRSTTNPSVFCFQEPSKELPNNPCINAVTSSPTASNTPPVTPNPTLIQTLLRPNDNSRQYSLPKVLSSNGKGLNFKPIQDVQAAEITPDEQDVISARSLIFLGPLTSAFFSLLSIASLALRIKTGLV